MVLITWLYVTHCANCLASHIGKDVTKTWSRMINRTIHDAQNEKFSFIKPGTHQLARAWFLKINLVQTFVCVCVCVCVSAPKAINN